MMRPTSPDPPPSPTASGREGPAHRAPPTDWRMRYEIGPVELIGWMILGGFFGVFVFSLTTNALDVLLHALGFHPPSLGWGAGLGIFGLFIMTGAAVPIVVYCRGKQKL